MRYSSQIGLVIVYTILAAQGQSALAQKGNGKPGGGDGGGSTSTSYTVLKLDDANGALPLSSYQGVMEINNVGGVVGTVELNGSSAAAHWQIGSNGTQLTLLPSLYSSATGCNNFNEVVGTTSELGASYWPSPVNQPTPLGDGRFSIPSDINDAGIVCGFGRENATSTIRLPKLWNVQGDTGNEFVLPLVPGYPHGYATKISEADENGNFFVIGYVGLLIGGADLHVRWSVQLDSTGDLTADPPSVFSNPVTSPISVLGLNDLGETCGSFYDDSLKWKDKNWLPVGYTPMLWSSSGTPTPLAILPSTVLSPNIIKAARDMNNTGTLVGECYAYQSSRKLRSGSFATVWSSASATPIALENVTTSSPFDSLRNAVAIDSSGIIVGTGLIGSQTCGFVAIPNP